MLKNLDRLRVFYYIFSMGSIVEASKKLNVTQSAVSQNLQKLENEINCTLFTRLHKKLLPTAAGDQLYQMVKLFMADLDSYTNQLLHSKEHPSGELRIGTPPEFGKDFLLNVISKFRELYPDVTFNLELGYPQKLFPLLKAGKIDFIIVDEFLMKDSMLGNPDIFLFEPIVNEKMILSCSKEYFDKHVKGDLSLKSLAKQDFISYTKNSLSINEWFKRHFSKTSVKVNKVLNANNHEVVVSGIKHSLGMGIVASHLVKNELKTGQLIHIKTKKPDIVNMISVVQLMDKVPTLAEKKFSRYVTKII